MIRVRHFDRKKYCWYVGYNVSNRLRDIMGLPKISVNPIRDILGIDVVKAENEEFDPEKGLAMAISKKVLGNKGNYYETFKKWLPEKESELKSVWTTTVQSVSLNDVISDFRNAVKKINNIKIDIEKEDKKDE